ncbi:ATP-dependent helicase [Oribacterium sp. WCC10]|uniref:ATP-dependent helicase n=1 Tax=Oribacterium sp. WCC10 TaxID=1855343 RepID=UPI0008E4AB3A|nr:ATP-dependent helicase [Oribacterium sp. WCC10]SFG51804.1 DNA helicase-2 / ATP-dependent DNA helicase PcrA [Oribacterium sp. WCC10]
MSFSNEQIQAIEHVNGPAMVLAGPGSGKTTVITHRILHLLDTGIPSEDILVITFTKDAAQEMETRFNRLVREKRYSCTGYVNKHEPHTILDQNNKTSDISHKPSSITDLSLQTPGDISGHQVTFGTFHSIFFFILRLRYHLSFKNIITDKDKILILKDLVAKERIDSSYDSDFFRLLLSEISKYKSMIASCDSSDSANGSKPFISKLIDTEKFHRIISNYKAELQAQRLLDFDDMLLLCHELFLKEPSELRLWQNRFRYILVDEFQDISPIQYSIVRMLAAPQNNLFIVGDDDQSIYRFRGAEPSIMLGFEKDYPDSKRILLGNNYRSKKEIVSFAVNIINHNNMRFKKKVTAVNGNGGSIYCHRATDPKKEYEYVIHNIKKSLKSGIPPEEIAVLFRTEMLSQRIARKLTLLRIPFSLKNKIKNMYECGTALDLISYIRLAMGMGTRADFLRIMNKPLRYISRKALDNRIPDFNKLKAYYRESPEILHSIDVLLKNLQTLRQLPTVAAIIYIRKKIGYEEHLEAKARETHQNLSDIHAIMDEIEESAKAFPDKKKWLEFVDSYGEELKKMKPEKDKGIRLMTFHSSKGLEFDIVHLIDVNEGIVPSSKAVTKDDIEEERRAFYVALTRARKEFHIYFTDKRYSKNCSPSRFIQEGIQKN